MKWEKSIKYKNNLAAVRSVVEEKLAIQESVYPVIELLNERFSRTMLKGTQVKTCPAAAHDDIVDNFESVHFIDSTQNG